MSTHWGWRVFLNHSSQYFFIGQSWMVHRHTKEIHPPYFNTTSVVFFASWSVVHLKRIMHLLSLYLHYLFLPPPLPVIARISYSINYPLISHTEEFSPAEQHLARN